jgi:hypothetical protein
MWEKFGTSGNGTGVGSIVGVGVGVGVVTSTGMTVGVVVGRSSGITGDGKGVDAKRVKAGWQAEVRREARTAIHNRRVINFISVSFLRIIRVKCQVH